MLYFGEFCKDLLRSVWFWNQVSKVESAFNVKYTDRVLLKQVRLIILVKSEIVPILELRSSIITLSSTDLKAELNWRNSVIYSRI